MPITRHLRKLLQRDGSLDAQAAASLWGAALDGAMDDLDLGALVAALALTAETREEAAGLLRAARSRTLPWHPPLRGRALAIPAYGLAPGEASLVALLAMLLPRFGVPVVVHGVLDSPCGASAAQLLRELGVLPCASLEGAAASLDARGAAFLPLQLFSPALAAMVALRTRLGFVNSAHRVAQALDPTGGAAVRVALCAEDPAGARCAALLRGPGEGDALVLTWPAGAPTFHLLVRPRIELARGESAELLFAADAFDARPGHVVPLQPHAAARWIERVVRGEAPVPAPALNLVAACLYAIGWEADLSRAKAAAAVQAGRLAA